MKIRNGFVSNSSSSSFIVISDIKYKDESHRYDINQLGELRISDQGETKFGWQRETYNDFYSKAAFCHMQIGYMEKDQLSTEIYRELLDDVIKEGTNAKHVVWDVTGYIDHQSSASEGECVEMFKSKVILHNFLFNSASYIQCQNDNDGYDSEN